MGASESKVTSEVLNTMLNKTTTNILNKSTTLQSTIIDMGQSAKIEGLVGSEINCTSGAGILQKIVGDVKVINSIDNATTNTLKTSYQTGLENKVGQFQEIAAQLGSTLGTAMKQETKSKIKNEVENIIENNMTTENINEVLNQVSFNQDGVISIAGKYTGPCSIDQSQVLSFQASSIVQNLADAIVENETITNIFNETIQEQKVELTGLAEVVDSVGDAVKGIIGAATGPFIALVVGGVVFLLLGGGLAFTGSDPGTPASQWSSGTPPNPKTGLKILGGFLLILFLGIVTYIIVAWFSNMWPFTNIPQEVIDNGCEEEYKEVLPIKKEIDAAKDEAEEEELLLENKDVIDEFAVCMGIEREDYVNNYEHATIHSSSSQYSSLKEAYKHSKM